MTQIFLTGRIIRWLGLAAALAFLPLLSDARLRGARRDAGVRDARGVHVLRRGGELCASTNPAMEVLFTVVKREDKYKAKNVIETFVYRGGDQVGGVDVRGFHRAGLTLVGISFVAVPLSAVWLGLGLWLGRRQAELARGVTAAAASGRRPQRHEESLVTSSLAVPSPFRRSAASRFVGFASR